MKKICSFHFLKSFLFILVIGLAHLHTVAQDTVKTVTTTSTTSSEPLWYMQPWVWAVGGVILLFLLIALFSGGSKKKEKNTSRTDKVIITKTVRTETDVDN